MEWELNEHIHIKSLGHWLMCHTHSVWSIPTVSGRNDFPMGNNGKASCPLVVVWGSGMDPDPQGEDCHQRMYISIYIYTYLYIYKVSINIYLHIYLLYRFIKSHVYWWHQSRGVNMFKVHSILARGIMSSCIIKKRSLKTAAVKLWR